MPTHKGLSIDPCVPKDFGDYELTRKFRGVTYHIHVSNPDHVEKGVKQLLVDGTAEEGNVIPFSDAKSEYDVQVVMG